MANVALSSFERVFILQGIQDNFRSDGRNRLDYRPIELETNIVTHANGSARVRLTNSDIIVCVKAEICVPNLDSPDKGKIEFFVDCSANATPEFEGRGGEQLAREISDALMKAYRAPQTFNYKSLCLIPGQQCWKLYIDILILECGGNLFDAVSLTVKAALFNTKLPKVKVESLDGEIPELVISDHPLDYTKLNVDCIPLFVTICKIGKHFVIDPTAEEEECGLFLAIIGVVQNNDKDLITYMHTCTEKSFNQDQFMDSIQFGISASKGLNTALLNALKSEEKKYNEFDKKEISGFLK